MTNKEEFIAAIAPKAQEIQRRYGVPASIAIAQAALESGWGANQKGNNLYGIKADRGWNGSAMSVATHEYVNGQRVAVTDAFRAYASTEDSMENYGQFLASNPRYGNVIRAGNANTAADALQRAGYATSPEYSATLKAIISTNNLTRFDDPAYSNYTNDEQQFELTRRQLNTRRIADPKPWDDFMDSFIKVLISAITEYANKAMHGQTVLDTTSIQPPAALPAQSVAMGTTRALLRT